MCFSQAAILRSALFLPPPQGGGCVPFTGLHPCDVPATCACGTSITTTDDNITAVVNASIKKANDVVLCIILIWLSTRVIFKKINGIYYYINLY